MIKEFDYLFKLVLIGDAGVGKSSVLTRFVDDIFMENYLSTLGVDFKFGKLQINKKDVKLQIWDTAGQERFRTITNIYFKNSNSIILTYDMTSLSSFNNLRDFWLGQVEQHADEQVQLVLLGNKMDADDEIMVNKQEAQEFANNHKMLFFQVSAKTGDNIIESFTQIATQLVKINSQKEIVESNLNIYNENQNDLNVCGGNDCKC